jgi:Tol biopolymer transport system component
MMKTKLTLFLVMAMSVLACSRTANVGKYVLVVETISGKGLFFGRRATYAIDEHGTYFDLNMPKKLEWDSYPEWSPNGQWIAHRRVNPNPKASNEMDIYFMRADDFDNVIRVTEHDSAAIDYDNISWSPDGDQIMFAAYDSRTDHAKIYLLDVGCILRGETCASEPTFLVLGGSPDWSPDGKKLVYNSDDEIYVMDLQNPDDQVKIYDRGYAFQWSPDGKKIAFVSDYVIYTMDADGSDPTRLIPGAEPRWSPDGKKIAFIGTKEIDPNLGVILNPEVSDSTGAFIMNADGTNVTRLTKSDEELVVWITWISTEGMK